MRSEEQSNIPGIHKETAQDLKVYVGPQANHYLESWSRIEERKGRISWSWPAFFLGFLWFAYRKIHYIPALFILSLVVLDYVFLFGFGEEMISGIMATVHLILTLLAKKLYFNQALENVRNAKQHYPNQEARHQQLKGIGGTSWLWPLFYLFLFFLHYLIYGWIREEFSL